MRRVDRAPVFLAVVLALPLAPAWSWSASGKEAARHIIDHRMTLTAGWGMGLALDAFDPTRGGLDVGFWGDLGPDGRNADAITAFVGTTLFGASD